MLTIAQKSSVRRHLGYPVVGLLQTSVGGGTLAQGSVGYRFLQAYGFLEYKLNNLNPDEEARVTGNAFAAVALTGPQPNQGDTITVNLSGGGIASPQAVTVTAGAPNPTLDNRLTLLNALAGAVSLNTVLQAAGIIALTPYGTGPYSQNAIPLPEIGFSGPQAFSFTASGVGVLAPQVTATGAQLPPTTSLDGVTNIYGYLPILDGLEGAYASTSQNLDTMKADVWTGRANEAGQRMSLYTNWQGMLSDFLGIPMNPDKRNDARRSGAIRFA